jgi:hypothetical protein
MGPSNNNAPEQGQHNQYLGLVPHNFGDKLDGLKKKKLMRPLEIVMFASFWCVSYWTTPHLIPHHHIPERHGRTLLSNPSGLDVNELRLPILRRWRSHGAGIAARWRTQKWALGNIKIINGNIDGPTGHTNWVEQISGKPQNPMVVSNLNMISRFFGGVRQLGTAQLDGTQLFFVALGRYRSLTK